MRHTLFSILFLTTQVFASSRLINGTPVAAGTWKEVIKINSQGSNCTATVVGPRVIVTASHCATNGAIAKFSIDGKEYQARMARSPLYPGKDHDIALGVTDSIIDGVQPVSIGGKATVGLGITLLGYGCTKVGGGGGNDGILRYGETVITEFTEFDMVSTKPGGAALCYGDSGGPAFVLEQGRKLLLGINSKGNLENTNYNTRTDTTVSSNFLKDFTVKNSVEICGINKDCGGGPNPSPSPTPSPTPTPAPTCNIVVDPQTLTIGQSLTARLTTTGLVTSASIDGKQVAFPSGELTWTPSAVGSFKAAGYVTGPGGNGSCLASYTVNPNNIPAAPTCTLTATPSSIKLGESVTLTMKTFGEATSGMIQGQNVSVPFGQISVTPQFSGIQSPQASVTGPGGTNTCSTSFNVDGPQPNVPNYTIIPTYCGENVVLETSVREVCLGIIKYSWIKRDVAFRNVLVITHSDTSKEVMPIILAGEKTARNARNEVYVKEDYTLYANGFVNTANGLQLDIRKAIVTKESMGTTLIPKAIEGRSAKGGQYFNVEKLKKMN